VLIVVVFLLNVKLVLHSMNAPVVHGKNAVVGIQRKDRVIINIIMHGNNLPSVNYFVLELLNFLRTRKATAELPTKVAVQ
jgi:hypothetical protein